MSHLYYLGEGRRWMRIYYLEPPTLGMISTTNVHQRTTSSAEDKKLYLHIYTQ